MVLKFSTLLVMASRDEFELQSQFTDFSLEDKAIPPASSSVRIPGLVLSTTKGLSKEVEGELRMWQLVG